MKTALQATFSSILIFIFTLIFFTLFGRSVRYTEIHNALELSMKHAITQLQFDQGAPVSEEDWINDFIESVAIQIDSNSDLTIHIYKADFEKGLLSAEAILTYKNPIGTQSSISTGKRTILLEKYYNSKTPLDNTKIEFINTLEAKQELSQEYNTNISAFEQMLLDAGCGTVVDFGDGGYGVLMLSPDHTINGKDGGRLLTDYLLQKGLCARNISGGWMNEQYYNWFAENVYKIHSNEEMDDGEWKVYE